MSALKLILRSAAFYWRTNLGVAAATAVATAVLVGALVVGDSVRYSLRQMALRRLGNVRWALTSGDRFFRARSVDRPGADSPPADLAAALAPDVAPSLMLDGSAKLPDGSARANRVQVVGVDKRFWRVGGARDPLGGAAEAAALNGHLARQLGVKVGEEVLLRVAVPSGLPREAPLSTDRDAMAAIRVTVRAIVGDEDFGRFSLRANQLAPFTAFLPLDVLQQRVEMPGKANVLLAPGDEKSVADLPKRWQLADADLELRRLSPEILELRTGRVFLDPPVARAAEEADPLSLRILTYFVDEIRHGDRAAPFCIVSAMDFTPVAPPPDGNAAELATGPESPVPADLAAGEILLNRWLADDLGAAAGDRVTLSYRVIGPMRTFEPRTAELRVRAVIPLAGAAADPNLMPNFPGLADVPNCRDWKPGIEIDLEKIRDKDEQYWNDHGGTPKAFVSLAAGRKMWGNRFGNLTAVRFRADKGEQATAQAILSRLDPAEIGLFFLPVREQALGSASPTSDFGGLFLGLSFFLIVAAVLLTGLLFVFGIEQRSRQVGTLLAVGFRPWRVRAILLAEGGVVALLGCVAGAVSGMGYTRLVLRGLATVWRGVSASAPIQYHAEPATVVLGAGIALAVALGAMYVTLVIQGRATARELLAAGAEGRASRPAGRGKIVAAVVAGLVCIAGAVVLIVLATAARAMDLAGAFFGSGFLLLLGGLSLCFALLAASGRRTAHRAMSLTGLGVRTCGRRRWRSLTTAGLLACGVFLVASVEAFRVDPSKGAEQQSSGTGGFALYGESALPVLHDLNDPARREKLRLGGEAVADARVVQMKVAEGDDASCLNLNRAQRPRLLGVDPARLAGRFTFLETLDGPAGDDPWALLARPAEPNEIPAVGDHDTLRWALHRAVGDTIEVPDERGRPRKIRLVGKIAGSVLQGNLLIAEERFDEMFPSNSGYRAFLIDSPPARADDAKKAFSVAMEDFGLELTTTADRLAAFSEVQNTYLSIFSALGGLGLLLGSVAIGIVVLRNVLERRGELALLRAVGFARGSLRWVVLCEHWAVLALGLICGVGSAVLAVLPTLLGPRAAVPYAGWLITLGGIAGSGLLWTYLAAAAALRGELLDSLRSE